MKCAAMTLVELLVVFAIIALIMAILVPSLQYPRRSARAIVCSSNLRQVALGLIAYDAQNGTFPYAFDDIPESLPADGPIGDLAYDKMGWWWFDRISDCLRQDRGKRTVLWCPSRHVREDSVRGNILCGNYGVNQSICKSSRGSKRRDFVGTPLSATYILHPGRTQLVADCGYSMITWWHAADSPPVALGTSREDAASYVPGLCINKERQIWEGQKRDAEDGRHPNRSINVGFVDGHVSRAQADDLLVEGVDDRYINRSPLWVPE